MTKNKKTISFFLVISTLLGLNLLILGKAFAASTQGISLNIQAGNLSFAVPTSVNFPKTIVIPGQPLTADTVLDPDIQEQTIRIIDPWSGKHFQLDLNLDNLTDQNADVIAYTNFWVVPLHANTSSDSIDDSSVNKPAGDNNVSSPSSCYYSPNVTGGPGAQPLDDCSASLTQFPNGNVSITLMERTTDTPSAGIYSIGMGLRANIDSSSLPAAGNYQGELTFSLYVLP